MLAEIKREPVDKTDISSMICGESTGCFEWSTSPVNRYIYICVRKGEMQLMGKSETSSANGPLLIDTSRVS